MEEVFAELDEATIGGALYENRYDRKLEQLSLNNNFDIIITSYDGTVIVSTGKQKNNTSQRLLDAILSNRDNEKCLEYTDAYQIILAEDDYVNEEYLVLAGTLSDGNLIMIRYAVENMNLSIKILVQTLIVVAIIVFIFTFIIGEIFANRLTKPIVELTDISKKMADLDFGVRYRPRDTRTEIDILGEHMNKMSEDLEDAYVNLRKANIELKKDVELKEKNEEMRNEFLSNVSHELKTPIALIQGYAEGLAEGMADDPESRAYYCDVIVDESNKMNKLVAQLMSLNELEYGSQKGEKEEFNLSELIRNVVDSSSILIEQAGITVEYEMEYDINVVSVYENVEMAFSNYLSNAIHYCKNEKIIRICQVDKDDKVCISINNTGDNIPEDLIPRLGEKFFKIDKARTREYGGSGVGLSIVKLAIESIDGKYGVYNTDNGVTFWFEISK
ncbi:MAG: HAMP domain-containing histidine kinase [Lachnospiraceae bacterium]|nr:HAMP domain-containing histidine kinase [Lachnospiraceae bacterium]